MELSGMFLMLMLGLRHGFDPDHIAIIDGMSVRLANSNPRLTKWTGTLFATGHGAVVTAIAVMISCVSHAWRFSPRVWAVLDWVPGLVLITVGLLNLRMLLGQRGYHIHGIKTFFLPRRLRTSSSPLAIVAIGGLFAMVFDTNTQAAAWAYAATDKLNVLSALVLGGCFSVGMIFTDTLDSRILYLLMRHATHDDAVVKYRRTLGWVIVAVSLLVGVYKTGSLVAPQLMLPEQVLTLFGVAFFGVLAVFYITVVYTHSTRLKKQINGN